MYSDEGPEKTTRLFPWDIFLVTPLLRCLWSKVICHFLQRGFPTSRPVLFAPSGKVWHFTLTDLLWSKSTSKAKNSWWEGSSSSRGKGAGSRLDRDTAKQAYRKTQLSQAVFRQGREDVFDWTEQRRTYARKHTCACWMVCLPWSPTRGRVHKSWVKLHCWAELSSQICLSLWYHATQLKGYFGWGSDREIRKQPQISCEHSPWQRESC